MTILKMNRLVFLFLFPVLLFAQSEEIREDSFPEMEVIAEPASEEAETLEDEYEFAPYKAPPLEPLALREVKSDKWDEATGGLDYSKDLPKPPKSAKNATQRSLRLPLIGRVLRKAWAVSFRFWPLFLLWPSSATAFIG
jgi:hypothetical protein